MSGSMGTCVWDKGNGEHAMEDHQYCDFILYVLVVLLHVEMSKSDKSDDEDRSPTFAKTKSTRPALFMLCGR